jgi:hypothetical protein
MDNVSTDTRKALMDRFGGEVGGWLWDRFTVDYIRNMEMGSTKLRLRLESSVVNVWQDEGLGISLHCAAKQEPGIAAPTAPN